MLTVIASWKLFLRLFLSSLFNKPEPHCSPTIFSRFYRAHLIESILVNSVSLTVAVNNYEEFHRTNDTESPHGPMITSQLDTTRARIVVNWGIKASFKHHVMCLNERKMSVADKFRGYLLTTAA